MFPKVAVVCGAHTELGKLVLRDLLRSPYVDLVHALAEVDLRDAISAHPANMRKLRLYIDSLDYVDRTLKKYVTDADIAFVTLGSSRDDLSSRGAYAFHKDNFDIPRRFVECMFDLGVQRIALLSADGAYSHVRGNEFLRVKGELVDVVTRLQREVGRHAPAVALFRVPLLLTNKADLHGRGESAPVFNKIKQHAILKFEMGASQAVHIRDVAKAMVADTLANAEREEESDLAFRFKKRQYDLTELRGPDIVSLANETRALQKSSYQRRKDKEAVELRISQFAKQEGAMQDEDEDEDDSEMGGTATDEGASHASGSLPGSQAGSGSSQGDGVSHEGSPHNGSPPGSAEDGLPRLEYVRQSSEESGSVPSTRQSSAIRRARAMPLGTIESLGQQLNRPPIKIRDNELLPDIEPDGTWRRTHSRPAGHLNQADQADSYNAELETHEVPEDGEYVDERLEDEIYYEGEEIRSNVSAEHSIGSPHSEELPLPDYEIDEENIDELPGEAYDPMNDLPQRETYASNGSHRVSEDAILRRHRSQSNTASAYLRESVDAGLKGGRSYPSSSRKHGPPSGRHRRDLARSPEAVQAIPPMQRFSALVGRVIAATDRPSQRRRRSGRRMVVDEEDYEFEEGEYEFEEEEDDYYDEPPIRGNGDMREAGNVGI